MCIQLIYLKILGRLKQCIKKLKVDEMLKKNLDF